MALQFLREANKKQVFEAVETYITQKGYEITDKDFNRPWGGFFVLNEAQAAQFIADYFPGYTQEQLLLGEKLSPKFLVVAPEKRLSWQYHFRRAEIWRVVAGPVKIATSLTNDEQKPKLYAEGEIIVLQKGERHRLIGADNYGVVAEIWQHTDAGKPSNEEDIVRLQDDYGRGGL